MAKASIHVKRHLTPTERGTIAVALELLARTPQNDELEEIASSVAILDRLLADDELRALAFELTRARKVKVCRTKQRET